MTKDIGIGIIGLAEGADLLAINADYESRLRVVALCDSNARAARQMAERHQIPFVTTDPVDLLSQPGVDAVALCGAIEVRSSHCMAAMSAGKRVLCVGPMARSLDEARDLTRESERLGGVLMGANPYRWQAELAAARSLAANGDLGDIRFVQSTAIVPPPSGGATIVNPWHLFAPLDLMRWIAGEVSEVHAMACDVGITVNVRFASGAVGSAAAIEGPFPGSARPIGLDLHGSTGSFVDGHVILNRAGGCRAMTFVLDDTIGGSAILGCVREFEARMHDNSWLPFDPWDGVKSIAVCAAVTQSLDTGASAIVPHHDPPAAHKRAHRQKHEG